jgi:pimeloyl-ACP methyl ester carboxylesterase
MRTVVKVFISLFTIIICVLLILAYNWMEEETAENIIASLEIFPSKFSIYEGDSVNLTIHFERENEIPIASTLEWEMIATGDTGEISSPHKTNSLGDALAVYYAPSDVSVLNQTVKILAKATWKGKTFTANAEGIINPFLHETAISISSKKKELIAGETTSLKAKIIGFVNGKWQPLVNTTIHWTFFGKETGTPGYKKLGDKKVITNQLGVNETFFFLSDTSANMTVIVTAQFNMNLTGDIDYMECRESLYLSVVPERPGEFPIVLIHGWIGSITDWLLNITWWNITQKLQQHGYKILDFDHNEPGIQYLEYEPSWEEHHIPWIAAQVSRRIRDTLVFNGYPPNQTIDIIAHSMGGLVTRFMAEHGGADVDFWNETWKSGDEGYPWYGDGDEDVYITGEQIDDIFLVGTPCRGVPPGIDESILNIIGYIYFPWWIGQIPDMIYHSKFLEAMGYKGCEIVDYHSIGGDINFSFGAPVDFDGDGINHTSDGLCPTESPYLDGQPLLIIQGESWPQGDADHISLIAVNKEVHEYIMEHLT